MTAATVLAFLGCALIVFDRPVKDGAVTDSTLGMILLALAVALEPSFVGKAAMIGVGVARMLTLASGRR